MQLPFDTDSLVTKVSMTLTSIRFFIRSLALFRSLVLVFTHHAPASRLRLNAVCRLGDRFPTVHDLDCGNPDHDASIVNSACYGWICRSGPSTRGSKAQRPHTGARPPLFSR